MWKFQVYEDQRGEYRWRLVAPNGKILADSGEGYYDRAGAKRAAANVGSRIANAPVEDI